MPSEPAPPLSLGGNLSDFPLPDVLTFLNMSSSTGALEFLSGPKGGRVYLEAGEVVWASSRSTRFALPAFLAARGLLTEASAAELMERSRRTGTPFTQLVASTGLVPAPELEAVEKVLCSEIVFDAMRWTEGKFAFLKDRRPPAEAPALRIRIQNLILEGARRLDEARRLTEEAGVDRSAVVTLAFGSDGLEDQLVLTPVEWGVVALINGKRTLGEVLALSPTGSEGETWRVLERLLAARMIRLHAPGKAEPGVPPPPPIRYTSELSSVGRTGSRDLPEEPPPMPPSLAPADKSDVRLVVGDEPTTQVGMFGRRRPARLVGALAAGAPATSFELSRHVLTIGRTPSNDIVLPDTSVSKAHAQLVQEEEGWRIVDLESTNGTWVNGERVDERRLSPEDQIRIGIYTLVFETQGWAPGTARPASAG